MVCLETSFLIDLLRGDEPARSMLEDLDAAGTRPTVTPVAAAELWVGAEVGSTDEREATEALIASLTWLPVTRAAARRAGTLRSRLVNDGSAIGITDALIAGIAIEHDETLVTRDDHFDRVPELDVRSY